MKDSNLNTINKSILITGGAGYLGYHLAEELLARGYQVRILDNLTFEQYPVIDDLKEKGADFYEGDIRHIEDVVGAMSEVWGVIHLAGVVGDRACEIDPESALAINYEATKVLIEIAKYQKLQRFLFASTCSVYGASDDLILNEGSLLNPVSIYAETKLRSEQLILSGLRNSGVTPTILRFATFYGPSKRMRFDLVINILTAKAYYEKEITIYGGEQWRPLIHVQDAAKAVVSCLFGSEKEIFVGEIFNIGSDPQNYQIKTLAELIISEFPETKVKTAAEVVDQRSYKVSFQKLQHALKFNTEYTINHGIHQIKEMFEAGLIDNYKDEKYYNVNYSYK